MFEQNTLSCKIDEITTGYIPLSKLSSPFNITRGLAIFDKIKPKYERYEWVGNKIWSDNSWQSLLTPHSGENGILYFLLIDSDDSDKMCFSVITYEENAGSVTFNIVDCGDSSTKVEVQDSSGTIQFRHDHGSDRDCTIYFRMTRYVS